MKIAIPSKDVNGQSVVDGHFGHCAYFTVMTVDPDKKQILSEEKMESPVGCGCKSNLAPTLASDGVSVLLAGNMGQGAVETLKAAGIEAVRGYDGPVRAVAESWLSGEKIIAPSICEHHHGDGHGDCQHHG